MARWRCTVCDYIHEGPEPPEECPICGVDKSHFERMTDEKVEVKLDCREEINKALRNISYGLYIISSKKDGKINGQCANTVFQITSEPVTLAIGINKNNLTHEYIMASQVFSVSVLDSNGLFLVRRFGFKSGRDVDKFSDIEFDNGSLEVPLLKNSLATFECRVLSSMDLGTHTLFVGEVICARVAAPGEPMTYSLYHRIKNRAVEEVTQSKVAKWRCKVCDYIHEGEEPPEVCPVCGVGPEEFEKIS